MIANVLPGLREVRTPLVIGYILLMSFWLMFFDVLPRSGREFNKEYPILGSIINHVGPVGVGAAVSLTAYLVGIFAARTSSTLFQIRSAPVEASASRIRQRARRIVSFTHTAEIDELDERLRELVSHELEDIEDDESRKRVRDSVSLPVGRSTRLFNVRKEKDGDPVALPPEVRVRVEAKSGRIDDRILTRSTDLFNEISRARSEAEFRASLIPSLLVLVVGLFFRTEWNIWIISFGTVLYIGYGIFLLFEALEYRNRARMIAMRAVVDELVTTPTIDLIRLRRDRGSKPLTADRVDGVSRA